MTDPGRGHGVPAFADFYFTNRPMTCRRDAGKPLLRSALQAYPIHPEVFDRLYEDWSTLEAFSARVACSS